MDKIDGSSPGTGGEPEQAAPVSVEDSSMNPFVTERTRDGSVSPIDPIDDPSGAGFGPIDEVPYRMAKWPFVVVGLLLLLGGALRFTWNINVPYYALSPGPVNDASDFITVPDDLADGDESGDLFFLTVSLRELNAVEYVGALLDREVDLSPRENIRPAGVTSEELRQQNIQLMDSSKTTATYVALTRLGYDVTFEGTGALVQSVIDESAAVGLLESNDLIVAVDGEPIEFSEDATELIGGRMPGETIELTIRRDAPDGSTEEIVVPITLKPFRFIDEDGNVNEDPDRGMVGVFLQDGPSNIVFPVEIDIDAQNIGGPSAGLMFALEIMNQLTPEDITHGYRIAGTGTINADGEVGPIGGIRQKVFGAIEVGADVVLVPAGDFEDAAEAASDDIQVVSIGTIDDAIEFLDTLTPQT